MTMIRWLSRKLEAFEEKSLLILVCANLSLIFTNVLLRYGFNKTLTWGEELSRYIFVAITYFGASAGVRMKGHIVVDLLIVIFPKTRKFLVIISNIFAALFCVLIFVSSSTFAYFLKGIGQTTTGLSIPMWIPYLSVIMGSLMMFFRFNEVFLAALTSNKK